MNSYASSNFKHPIEFNVPEVSTVLYFWNNGQWEKFISVAVKHVTYHLIKTLQNGTKLSPLSCFLNAKIMIAHIMAMRDFKLLLQHKLDLSSSGIFHSVDW